MKKRTIVLLVIGGIILVAGGIIYLNFRSSPKYSLLQISYALEDRNFARFEKYVDVDGTMSSLMDQIVEILQNNPAPVAKGTSWSNLAIGMGLFDIFKPQLTLLLKPQIQQWVESGKFKTQGPFSGNTAYPLPALWQKPGAFAFAGIEYEKREGDLAILGIGIKHEGFDSVLVFNIKMRNKGGYWQIAELTGLTEFQKKIERLEQKRVDHLNKPIIEELIRNLKIARFEKTLSENTQHKKKIKILAILENIGAKTITEYKIMLRLSDKLHLYSKEIMVSTDNSVAPEHAFSPLTKVNITLPEYGSGFDDPWLFGTPLNDMDMTLSIESLKFSDGTGLQLHKKWQDE